MGEELVTVRIVLMIIVQLSLWVIGKFDTPCTLHMITVQLSLSVIDKSVTVRTVHMITVQLSLLVIGKLVNVVHTVVARG